MPNLELEPKDDISSFRKLAIGTWKAPADPQVYGTLEVRMDEAMRYLAEFREKTGRRLTVSHLMAKAVAMALARCPDANAVLRYNRVYLRKRIGVFFQVLMADQGEAKADLSGATLYDVERKSLREICDEFETKVARVRARQDEVLEKTRSSFGMVPNLLMNLALKLLSACCFTLNLDLRAFGVPNDPFGSVMITNIGTLGLDVGYVPLVPYSRVPLLFAVGEVRERPVVDGGRLAVAQTMFINATFDHRLIDGFHAAAVAKVLREWLENPYQHFDAIAEVPEAPVQAITGS